LLALICSILSNLAQFSYTRSYKNTEASKVAAFQYSEILFCYVFDFCFLGNKWDLYSLLGTSLIIISGYLLKKQKFEEIELA